MRFIDSASISYAFAASGDVNESLEQPVGEEDRSLNRHIRILISPAGRRKDSEPVRKGGGVQIPRLPIKTVVSSPWEWRIWFALPSFIIGSSPTSKVKIGVRLHERNLIAGYRTLLAQATHLLRPTKNPHMLTHAGT